MPAKIDFPNDKATTEWLDSHRKSTRGAYVTYWQHFLEFTGQTGDQILESRKTDKDYAWEKKVLEFKNWMIKEKGSADNMAVSAISSARANSFLTMKKRMIGFACLLSLFMMLPDPSYL